MRLYFNGCSHTNGDDLSDQTQAWPSLVAQHYKCDYVNDSVSGGTNDRILYRTLKYHQHFDKFYIAWTYTSRFTRYRTDNSHAVDFNVQRSHHTYGSKKEFLDYANLHYRFWNSELFNFKLWLQNIILLQRFFESIKKPYVMINAHNNLIDRWSVNWKNFNNSVKSLLCLDTLNDDQLFDEHEEIQSLLKQIDYTNYFGWNQWWIVQLHSTYPLGETNHLLDKGHLAIADYIIKNDTN